MSLVHDISTPVYMAVVLLEDSFTAKMKEPFENHNHPDWRGSNYDTLMNLMNRAFSNDLMKRKGTNPAPFLEGADVVVVEHCGRKEDTDAPGWSMGYDLAKDGSPEVHHFSTKYSFDSQMDIQCIMAIERIAALAESLGMVKILDTTGKAENPEGTKSVVHYRDEAAGVTAKVTLLLGEYETLGWLRQFTVQDKGVKEPTLNYIEVTWSIDAEPHDNKVPESLSSKKLKQKTIGATINRTKYKERTEHEQH